jgi:hypothetical protein
MAFLALNGGSLSSGITSSGGSFSQLQDIGAVAEQSDNLVQTTTKAMDTA